ncbi:MAG: amidohydrolase [Bacillota bacterium]
MNSIDLLLYNGTIYTIDDKNTIFHWAAVRNGRIIDLGYGDGYKKHLPYANEEIDLKKKVVLPGFYDSFVHLVQTGLNMLSVDLSHAQSISEVLSTLHKKTKDASTVEFIRAIGFDELKIKEKRLPTRKELDECCPNHPVWVNRVEYHTSVVNSLMLHLMNLPFNIDGISRDEKGLPNGALTGKANAFLRSHILNSIPNEIRKKGVDMALKNALMKGITSINAMEGGFQFHDKDAEFIYHHQDLFPIDVNLYYQTINIHKVLNMGLKRIGGGIFLDGSFGSRTAALAEPYFDDPSTRGVLYFTQQELNDFILESHRLDLQIGVHAIGSRSIEQIISAYEYAQEKYPSKDIRHRIEHCELPTDDHLQRAKKLNLIFSMQPAYEFFWGGEDGMYQTRLGTRRKMTNPFRKIIEAGLIITGGSDSDVTPMDPLLGIHAAVNHPTPEFSISVYEAIKLFTINGAKAVFEEKIKGSIEIGKYGDMVVLDKDPFFTDTKHLKDIQVLYTIKEGNILFTDQVL